MSFLEHGLRRVPWMGKHPAFGLDGFCGFRGFGRSCVALFASLALVGPMLGHAAQAGVDVPMRRDIGTTVVNRAEAAAPDGLVMAAAMVRQEIELLRRELGVNDFPPRAELHSDRRSVHVYVKSQEVMSKLAAVQRRLGVAESAMRGLPLAGLSSDDALLAVQDILDGIRTIKTQMVIESGVEAEAAATPRTLSAAYRNLADSSTMLDGLVGRGLGPGSVFQGLQLVAEDLNLIAAKLQVTLDANAPPVDESRESVDVAQQALRAAYKIVLLQTRLGMDASAVPTLTMVRVTPAEAYDLIGILRAELARIKWHLGVNVAVSESMEPAPGRELAEVFAQMLLVVRNLDLLAAGAER